MQVTLETILEELEKFVADHYQLLSFGFGKLSEISTKSIKYPLLWVTPAPSSISGAEMNLSFDMYVLDLEQQDLKNLRTILNETLLIGNDILVKYFQTAELNGEYDLWTIKEDAVSMEAIDFKFDDVLSGWVFTFELSIENGLNTCVLPIA